MRVVADTNAGNGIAGDFDYFQFTRDSARRGWSLTKPGA